jgi:hypothetical protein
LKSFLLFGTGQDSGASPSVWLTLVICLLCALFCSRHHCYYLSDEQNADAFVDDTANGVSDAHQDDPMSVTEIVGHLLHTVQSWDRILYSSGGALEIPKCFWHLVYWEWSNGRPQMMNSVSTPATIAITKGSVPVYMVVQQKET